MPLTVYVKVPNKKTMTGMTIRGCLATQSRMTWAWTGGRKEVRSRVLSM
jgi:hypothetical protein